MRARSWLHVRALATIAAAWLSAYPSARGQGAPSAPPRPPRVALVAQSMQAAAGQALDLALVELTKRGDLDLVEREAIHAVLREHQIALTETDSGLRVGQLLRADLIGVVDATPDGKELGGIVVLDSASGVVFANEGLAGMKAAEAATAVATAVSSSVRKRALPADQRNTVCLLGARNSEFARSKDAFCETVAYLVERRLLQAPGVTTLDRRRLDAVLMENGLPGQAERKALLPSLRLVELDFRRGAQDGAMKVVLRLSDAKGNTIATGEVAGPEEAPQLVELAGARVCELLKVPPPAHPGDLAAEANRFRKQADFLAKRGLWEASLQALTAADGLHPGTRAEQLAHAGRIAARARAVAEGGERLAALAIVEQAMDFMDERKIIGQSWYEIGKTLGVCMRRARAGSAEADRTAEIRQRFLETMGLVGDFRVGPYMAYPGIHLDLLSVAEISRDRAEFFRFLNGRLEACLRRELDPKFGHADNTHHYLSRLTGGPGHDTREFAPGLPFDRAFIAEVRAALGRMTSHPRAVVQLEGRLGQLYCDIALANVTGRDLPRAQGCEATKGIVRDALAAAAAAATPPGDIPFCYAAAEQATQTMLSEEFCGDRAAGQEQATALLRGMLANRHLAGSVVEYVLELNTRPCITPEAQAASRARFARYTAPLLDPLLAAMGDPSVRRFDLTDAQLMRLLEPLRGYRSTPDTTGAAPAASVAWTARVAPHLRQFMGVLARDGERQAYVVAGWAPNYTPNNGGRVAFSTVDLADGRVSACTTGRISTSVNFITENMLPAYLQDEFIAAAARDEAGRLFLATPGDGLHIIAPGESGSPRRLGSADGFPNDVFQSVAVVSNVIYAALGDARTALFGAAGERELINHFIRHDLSTGEGKVLASTGRAVAESPWDNLPEGFWVRYMQADGERNRLLIVLNAGDTQPANGLWEYRLGDGGFRQLLRLDRAVRQVVRTADGSLWLLSFIANPYRPVRTDSTWAGLVRYDPAAETGRLVCVSQQRSAGPLLPVTPDTFSFAALEKCIVLPAMDWLYYFQYANKGGDSGLDVRRRSLLTGRDERIDTSDHGPMGKWGYLDWLPGAGLLLVGDGHELRALRPNHARSAHGLLDAKREQFVGRWSYMAQGKQWEREFLADGTARLRVDGKDTPHFDGFTWTVENGALLLRRRDGTLDERSYLADADTLTFTLTTWEAARRVGPSRGTNPGETR